MHLEIADIGAPYAADGKRFTRFECTATKGDLRPASRALNTHHIDRDLHVSMVVRPEMIPFVSSKVLRCVLDKGVFDYLIGLQRRLRALAFDDQLVRPDLPDDMKLAIMDVIRGPEVNNVLRGTLLKICNIKGFHHFIVKKKGMGSTLLL